jgi:hypothetical protein
MEPVSRMLSADYIVLVNAAALLFNIYLIVNKRWNELAIFYAAVAGNVLVEIGLMVSGARGFMPDTAFARYGALACLTWSDNGLFATIAYMNVRYWLKKDYPVNLIFAVNMLFFIGLPLLSLDYNLAPLADVKTWRMVQAGQSFGTGIALLVFLAVIMGMGYSRVLARIMIVGVAMEAAFEARLFLVGVRPLAEGQSMPLAIFRNTTEFKFPLAMCLAFIIIKLIWKLPELKDKALARGQ